MPTLNDYLGKVLNEHSDKPKYINTLTAVLAPIVRVQEMLRDLPIEFDLDNAKGVQLDTVGLFVGLTRQFPVPLQQNLLIWDLAGHGWDQGLWPSIYETENSTVTLNDDRYRTLLRARILANHWDGTMQQVRDILAILFPDPSGRAWVEDNAPVFPDVFFRFDDDDRGWDSDAIWEGPPDTCPTAADPEVTFCFAQKSPDMQDIFMLSKALVPLVGAGVRVKFAIATQQYGEMFGFDIDDDRISGWDTGVWGADIDRIVTYGLIPADPTDAQNADVLLTII